MRFVAGRGAAAKSHLEDVAGRCADAEVFLAVGTMEKRHREADAGWSAAKRHREDAARRGRRSGRDTAGRGAVAESHREDVAGWGADAEVFLAVGAVAKRHREADAGWSAAKRHREAKAKKKPAQGA